MSNMLTEIDTHAITTTKRKYYSICVFAKT